MAITNVSKPTTSYTNTDKVNIGLTWDTATMTWDEATFTWDSTASLIDNTSKPTTTFSNIAKPA